MNVERIAFCAAVEFFRNRDYNVEDVSRSRKSDNRGFDLVVMKDGERSTVEVKGTSHEWKIPDLYGTEVRDGALVADVLLLVWVCGGKAVSFCRIPRSAIASSELISRHGYRISESVKNSKRLSGYVEPFIPGFG